MMKYVTVLLENKLYLAQLEAIEELERERIYCRHGFTHLMDVARLAWIRNQKENHALDEEQIYLAALLHDIGRVQEYQNGISHAAAGKELAGEILLHIGYPEEQTAEILTAIEGHRSGETAGNLLGQLIKEADKASRACFLCPARASCKWDETKKNRVTFWR